MPLAVADRLHVFLRSLADAERSRMRVILWTALAMLVSLFLVWCRWAPPAAVAPVAASTKQVPVAAPRDVAPQQQQEVALPPAPRPAVGPKRSWLPANLPDLVAF